MKIAYADPPYMGQAKKHYSHDERCCEVNHVCLIGWLCRDFEAVALSCSSPSLRHLLPLVPEEARVAAWVKPFASFKPNVNPAYAWEPVIYWGGRKRRRDEPTARDWVSANITLRKGLSGAKPIQFCNWLFDLLGAQPSDSLEDVFPGTGIVTECWEAWKAQQRGEWMQHEMQFEET